MAVPIRKKFKVASRNVETLISFVAFNGASFFLAGLFLEPLHTVKFARFNIGEINRRIPPFLRRKREFLFTQRAIETNQTARFLSSIACRRSINGISSRFARRFETEKIS